jgi:hypothetical protein
VIAGKWLAKELRNVNDDNEQLYAIAQEVQGLMAQFKIGVEEDWPAEIHGASARRLLHTTQGAGAKTAAAKGNIPCEKLVGMV